LIAGAGQSEHAINLLGAAREHQPASSVPSPAGGVDDDPYGGAVNEGELAQVEHQQAGVELGVRQGPAKPRRGREIQRARHVNPGRAGACLPRAVEWRRHSAANGCC
jgi:hypothetical protein